ncbi:MAG: DUF420 domain-containing protein [Planctomycetota bacterium]|nr:DUF420 domain-containing protein [Planctomycetota bacterium]MDA1211604.1 DUF420 domain-containing protein [Planctomycetota bacterium]
MSRGFLGYQTSLMLDVVVCALVLVVPLVILSLYLVKVRHNYLWHRNLQILLGVTLLVAVGAFEIDMQLVHGGWENIVSRREPSRSPEEMQTIRYFLWFHLCFAVTTPVLWIITMQKALKHFPNPPTPSAHSHSHKRLGWLSTIDLVMTSLTGLWWYYVAFIR